MNELLLVLKEKLKNTFDHPEGHLYKKQASVSIIISQQDSEFKILFIKRVTHPLDPWSGHMAFPGGHLDIGSENSLEAAMREAREEVGLNLCQFGEYLGSLDDFQVHFKGVPQSFIIYPHVFFLNPEAVNQVVPDESEVASYFWINLDHFNQSQNMKPYHYQIGNQVVELPSFEFQEEFIWGITYMIMMDLFQKLEGLKLPQKKGNLHLQANHWIHYPLYPAKK
ncbi:MAG: hypothetical protein COW00_11540 [Bdellovibrio sp. CG12_big_fil_rev_8_21_14_0_65_39_13]|nr:MAG: hypothetical protein COW78_04780 [Bdellovibrio sp. CG22_combo_CG10-13_8_21_14_all_39_27]PIQ59355.1 MAG: hypothetical protein COW00_11540 [Bdellovibrio sp. CG12_big_fil_rev_8_21_14_0_65_39_13]PIR32776.1 MAG: hypothetical protein COV37_18795 [Bdellovibrio sp. CG11_big_fil_rev_8_21_14_0_20_39_38]PJB52301.1 MAG: hypothetical protein CO099_13385 [Bdellovibrio sp. CG_4_9_14_3_um_filter_39_7]